MIGQTSNQRAARHSATTGAIIIVLLLLVTAGSVAAVYLMKSETTVTENTSENQYIVISSSDYTDILDGAVFNTVNNAGVSVTYSVENNTDTDSDGVYDARKISNAFSISVASTNVSGTTFDLFVSVSEFSKITGLEYLMSAGSSFTTYTNGDQGYGWYFTGLDLDTDITMGIYVSDNGVALTSLPDADLGFTNYDGSTNPVTVGSVFTFVAQVPA